MTLTSQELFWLNTPKAKNWQFHTLDPVIKRELILYAKYIKLNFWIFTNFFPLYFCTYILYGLLSLYTYLDARPSTVFYIMPVIDKMVNVCCLEIICKFIFWTLKSTFSEYMKGYRQLFDTFNEIMKYSFDKAKWGTTIFTNIKILRIYSFWLVDIFKNTDPFILLRLSCLFSTTDASFDTVTE